MAKRGYKLHDFVAHGSDVNCLSIGKKSSRIFITGGEDRKVNIWEFGKSVPNLSLSGHTNSVQSVNFDSAEVLVLAGSSNGTIKLWDLEEAKLVRTITGHRSNCTAVEFHPFGEFFASGSSDTDLKIWDIRKKGSIHTYKGHSRGIRTIRFTPDGRWVVTGGEDHVVKLWDLTAGKLLHDFKFHNGTIRCIDFHPQEFLLATGSTDQTVNFWDLETFELIGSAGPEAASVCSMVFHPDGRTLFCGLDETLKVLSWEPIRCHDSVDMGWSTLGDLSICEGKLLGCSYHQSRIGVWAADISLIGPYASGVMPKDGLIESNQSISTYGEDHCVEVKQICTNSSMPLVSGPDSGGKTSPIDTLKGSPMISNVCSQSVLKEDPVCSTKTTHLNSMWFRRNNALLSCHNAPQKFNSRFSSKLSSLNSTAFRVNKTAEISPGTPNMTEPSFVSREMSLSSTTSSANSQPTIKKDTRMELCTTSNTQATDIPFLTPVFVPRESPGPASVACGRKGTAIQNTASGNLQQMRHPSLSVDRSDSKMSVTATRPSSSPADDLRSMDPSFVPRLMNGGSVRADELNSTGITNAGMKFERIMSLKQPLGLHNDKDSGPPCSSSETSSVKYVRGVAVQLGRTRSLVERFEKREGCNKSYTSTASSSSEQVPIHDNLLPGLKGEEARTTARERKSDDDYDYEALLQGHDVFINLVKSRLTKLQVVRHFWERNGIKGAIDAVVKLPDYSVQVDVISVLAEKIDRFTLDIFSCLLPLLLGLLNSNIDRHVIVSLELLFELVKIFGPVIHSTVSASSSVGVDLQAEQRLERCRQCYTHLQKTREMLPLLIRNGGSLAKHAQKLNVALIEL